MKNILVIILSFFSNFWLIIPRIVRINLIKLLLFFESRNNKNKLFSNLFDFNAFIETLINERALFYNNGVHPKHRLMDYHQFFISNISPNDKILDIGCGYGEVAFSIARKFPNTKILGLDIDKDRLSQAIKNNKYKNLNFVNQDLTKVQISDQYDVLILSNVLEHIDKRVFFLRKIIKNTNIKKILIRIPAFERSWMIPFMKELNINYFSDIEHFIEHTKEEIIQELEDSNLYIIDIQSIWGEYWISAKVA